MCRFVQFVTAPDVTKDDGVYSGYFFEYNRKGRYSIAVSFFFSVSREILTKQLCSDAYKNLICISVCIFEISILFLDLQFQILVYSAIL